MHKDNSPNLELVLKNWKGRSLDSQSLSWSSPCTLKTPLPLSNSCFSL